MGDKDPSRLDGRTLLNVLLRMSNNISFQLARVCRVLSGFVERMVKLPVLGRPLKAKQRQKVRTQAKRIESFSQQDTSTKEDLPAPLGKQICWQQSEQSTMSRQIGTTRQNQHISCNLNNLHKHSPLDLTQLCESKKIKSR